MLDTTSAPLKGIRILDLTHVVAGPFASRYLALMGAEIIKIENPKTKGDMTRSTGPIENNTSIRFCSLNHNKKSISLDLSTEQGKDILLKLIEKSDVVIDNFRPGTLEKLGLPFTKMQEVNPRIVYGNLSGFGTYGPYKDLPAYDIIAQALSGMMMLNGEDDMPPIKVGTSIADIVAGMNLVIGVLAALRKTEQTKKGCCFETNLTDSLVSVLTMEYISYLHSGITPERIGNNYREWCPADAYAARDGFYVLAIGKEDEFIRLAKDVLGNDELAHSEQFNSHSKRVKNRDLINSAISDWSKDLTVAEVCMALKKFDIPCAPVYDIQDVTEDTHISHHRNMFVNYTQPEVGDITLTNIPVKFHNSELPKLFPAPQCGEHTDEILKDILSLSEQDISLLKQNGIIKTNK